MAKITNHTLNNLFSTSRKKMEESFNKIYYEFSYLVYYVALEIVKDKDIAEDITNETFLRFFDNKDQIKNINKLKYWLVSTSKNLSLNYVKKRAKEENYDEDSYEDDSNNDDFMEYIDKFKDFLNKEEVDLIVYHLFYGFTFKELADISQVSINVIASKYKRSIDKVRKHYKGGF